MTAATEAVTPEQRAENLYWLIDGIATAKAMAAIAATIREAEANALRRAAVVVEQQEWPMFAQADASAAIKSRAWIRNAIRSLLPKEAGK